MDVVFIDSKFITEETWRKVKARSRSVILSILNKVCTYTVICAFFCFMYCVTVFECFMTKSLSEFIYKEEFQSVFGKKFGDD